MDWLISTAHAAQAAPGGEGAWGSILLLVGFVLIFYFLLWRPQSKRAKEHRELVGNLNDGDEVVTGGGMLGTIEKVKDDFLVISVANGVQLKVQKSAVARVLPKGTIAAIDE